MVFSIQTQHGALDIYKQDITWSFTNFRFCDGLKDQYSTDIEIPKTKNNCDLLEVSGLLDSPTQLYGERIQPCILEINGLTMDVYLQVVKITDNTITICLYERTLPVEEREKNIARLREDNHNTIMAWNVNTLNAYPQWFKNYNYGMTYNHNYAQLHPVMNFNDIIDIIASDTNLGIQHIDNNYYTMATGKWLCPQNERQTLEGLQTEEGFRITGGQHITNDLSFSYSTSDTDRITFNRGCHVEISLWVSWVWKNNGYKVPFVVNHHKSEDSSNNTVEISLDALNFVNEVNTATFAFDVEAGDHISFGVINGNMFDMVRCLADMRITNYEITEDDYGKEMRYVGRVPRLVVYQWASNNYQYWYFDGSTYDLGYHRRNTSNTLHRYMTTTWTSFAWFGFWANLPEMKVSEWLYGACWLIGKRVRFMNGEVWFEDPNQSTVLENAVIMEMQPATDKLGRKNFIKWDGDDTPLLVSTIDNKWLEEEHVLHTSPFGKITNIGQFIGQANQYSNPEYDTETGEYKCDFNEVGFLMWYNDTSHGGMTIENNNIRGVNLKTFGLEKITQVMLVTINSKDYDCDVDYVYLDGRKFMVVSGDTDLNTRETTLSALLVPFEEEN